MIRRFSLVIGGALVLTILQAALSVLAPNVAQPAASGFLLVLLSNALIAALMTELARRISDSYGRRALWLWLIWGGIQANSLLELLLFDIGVPQGDTQWLVIYSLTVSAAFAAAVGWAVVADDKASSGHTTEVAANPRMLVIAPFLYIVLYLAAGMLVWPYVEEFYRARPMPPMAQVLSLQVVRGLAFGAIVLLLARVVSGTRGELIVFGGLTLSILGGIAPLIVPNPYLPGWVRLAHLPETALSNFAFGAILAWALTARRRAVRSTATA